jgi:hypothetical protein
MTNRMPSGRLLWYRSAELRYRVVIALLVGIVLFVQNRAARQVESAQENANQAWLIAEKQRIRADYAIQELQHWRGENERQKALIPLRRKTKAKLNEESRDDRIQTRLKIQTDIRPARNADLQTLP